MGACEGARSKIWLAEVRDGRLARLESGRSREEIVDELVAEAERDPALLVGLDFAFSMPLWFFRHRGLKRVEDLWGLVAEEGEAWLAECEPPFWGKPGRKKPELPEHFRRTEMESPRVGGSSPKSVFQIGGAGAVGTGSLRGIPCLGALHAAGFSIWPFHAPTRPIVIEIYPRLLTGPVVKSSHDSRSAYLRGAFPELGAGVALPDLGGWARAVPRIGSSSGSRLAGSVPFGRGSWEGNVDRRDRRCLGGSTTLEGTI